MEDPQTKKQLIDAAMAAKIKALPEDHSGQDPESDLEDPDAQAPAARAHATRLAQMTGGQAEQISDVNKHANQADASVSQELDPEPRGGQDADSTPDVEQSDVDPSGNLEDSEKDGFQIVVRRTSVSSQPVLEDEQV
jgi:hypothetical protein